eukprot:TRINITY_DN8712_c0_g1_i4.p1 TRINITY_DN8712_c0_g1~~TRINITY_DN8712_c0_g1_i4.p1  ORF type:complete len:1796 (+),score=315.58 TRINITY_DN8712_c0_g1_i4:95-5482(+)
MVAKVLRDAGVLLHKNAKLKWRTKLASVVEFVFPIVITALLLGLFWAIVGIMSASTGPDYKLHSLPKLSSFDDKGALLYTPSTHPDVERLMDTIRTNWLSRKTTVKGFADVDAMMAYTKKWYFTRDSIWGGITFNLTSAQTQSGRFFALSPSNNTDDGIKAVNYAISMRGFSSSALPSTRRTVESVDSDEHAPEQNFVDSGFVSLQMAIDRVISSLAYEAATNTTATAALNSTVLEYRTQRFAAPPHNGKDDSNRDLTVIRASVRGGFIAAVLCVWMVAASMLGFYRLLADIVGERESRIREAMRMMGLSTVAYWSTWYLTAVVLICLTGTLDAALLRWAMVLEYSDQSIFIVPYLLFNLSLISFSFFVCVFISRAKLAGPIVIAITVALTVCGYFVATKDVPKAVQYLLALFSPIAFSISTNIMLSKEGDQEALMWGSSNQFQGMMWMMALDTILYIALAWYADNVYPSEYGTTQPLYFPLQRSYWRSVFGLPSSHQHQAASLAFGERKPLKGKDKLADDENDDVPAEVEESLMVPLMSVQGLRKVYSNGVVAVHNLDLNVYEGQITALLGHNGAGKSTTIHMLTGLVAPSGGDAVIAGHSLRDSLGDIRRTLGVCPQHDILWDTLTVAEHLRIFAVLKGVAGSKVESEVDEMVASLGLEEKRHAMSASLSGGQKRKLCVGIALIGGSKVVFLDEPTSGMDPVARRSVWELLQKNRKDRAIILTTHFMDEADILGDRIAILSKGRLRCAGSSLFLKSKFGIGYVLTMVRKKDKAKDETMAITKTIKRHIPTAQLLSNVAQELSFQLPRDKMESFAELFEELETNGHSLGIESYGISQTTLEEVFMRLAQEEEDGVLSPNRELGVAYSERKRRSMSIALHGADEVAQSLHGAAETAITYSGREIDDIEAEPVGSGIDVCASSPSIVQQTRAMLVKRFKITIRDWKGFIFQVVVPIALLIGGVVCLVKMRVDVDPDPALPLAYELLYKDRNVVWSDGWNKTNLLPLLKYVDGFNATGNWSASYRELSYSNLLPYIHKHYDQLAMGMVGYNMTDTASSLYLNATLLFNPDTQQALPAFINSINQASLRYLLRDANYSINIQNQPFPVPDSFILNLNGQIMFGFIFLAAFAFLPASLAVFIVQERVLKAKHLQHANGASKLLYWGCNLLWDWLVYLPTVLASMIILWASQWQYFGNAEASFAALVLLLLYGAATFPLTYIVSMAFRRHSLAQGVIAVLYLIPGIFAFMCIVSVTMSTSGDSSSATGAGDIASNVCNWVFCALSPVYCLLVGLMRIEDFLGMRYSVGEPRTASLFTWTICGQHMLFLAAHAIVWLLLLLFLDHRPEVAGFFRSCCCGYSTNKRSRPIGHNINQSESSEHTWLEERRGQQQRGGNNGSDLAGCDGDSDVMDEQDRVLSGQADQELVVVKQLRKEFKASWESNGKKVAVNDLSLGIARGECFGLLGANGAGKTTTLRILTGDEHGSSGDAEINGHSILTSIRSAQRNIGFCPQFDALLPTLTAREHLTMYARLKGVPSRSVDTTVQAFIDMMNLNRHADKLAGTYSGGNKRRLSLAIALLGNPPVVFLDEPSTGMDPMGRRYMWNVISKVREGRAIILTTHSMEESDVLCTRIGIMKAGQLVCLGTSQHLKSKHGTGYHIEIKLRSSTSLDDHDNAIADGEAHDALMSYMSSTFPTARLAEHHCNKYHFDLLPDRGDNTLSSDDGESSGNSNTTLPNIFARLQQAKDRLRVDDYAVTQPTLEQIFLKMIQADTSTAESEDDDAKRLQHKRSCCRSVFCCCC